MTSIPVGTCWISRNNLKRHYLKNKRHFLDCFLICQMYIKFKTLKKKVEYSSLVISKVIDSERGGYLNV